MEQSWKGLLEALLKLENSSLDDGKTVELRMKLKQEYFACKGPWKKIFESSLKVLYANVTSIDFRNNGFDYSQYAVAKFSSWAPAVIHIIIDPITFGRLQKRDQEVLLKWSENRGILSLTAPYCVVSDGSGDEVRPHKRQRGDIHG